MSTKEYPIISAPRLDHMLGARPPQSALFNAEGKRFKLYLYGVTIQKEKIEGKNAYAFKGILARAEMTQDDYRIAVKQEMYDFEGVCVPSDKGGVIRER